MRRVNRQRAGCSRQSRYAEVGEVSQGAFPQRRVRTYLSKTPFFGSVLPGGAGAPMPETPAESGGVA